MNAKSRYKVIAGIILIFMASACMQKTNKPSGKNIGTIDMFADTKGDDHVFLGANIPFGSIQIGPQTHSTSENMGYNYNDSIITGFILSYIGNDEHPLEVNHENDIRFFPATKGENESRFSHSYELATPGYYSVYMHETDIAVELTATQNTVYQRYFFPQKDSVQVVINKELIEVNDTIVTGKTPSTYFIIQFSQPIKGIIKEKEQKTTLLFDTTEEEMLYTKIGVSTISIDDATTKLENELADWDFEEVADSATKIWNEYLIKE